jgi:hypothetical protein
MYVHLDNLKLSRTYMALARISKRLVLNKMNLARADN